MIGDERAVDVGKTAMDNPNQGHFRVSIIKSIIRIIGCGFLISGSLALEGTLLLIAELFGIVEEMV